MIKKLWCQKGMGCVCVGMLLSLLWCGGGCIFLNLLEENFLYKVNKKMYCVGFCLIFLQLVCEGCLLVVEDIIFEVLKIKLLVDKFKIMGFDFVLIIIDMVDENLYLVLCNLLYVVIVELCYVDLLLLIYFKKVLVMKVVVVQIEELLL